MATKYQAIQELNKYIGIIREYLKKWEMETEHSNFIWNYLNEFVERVNVCQEIEIDDCSDGHPKDFSARFRYPKIGAAVFSIINFDFGEGDEDNGMAIILRIFDWQQDTTKTLDYHFTNGSFKQIEYMTEMASKRIDFFIYRNGKPFLQKNWINSHLYY